MPAARKLNQYLCLGITVFTKISAKRLTVSNASMNTALVLMTATAAETAAAEARLNAHLVNTNVKELLHTLVLTDSGNILQIVQKQVVIPQQVNAMRLNVKTDKKHVLTAPSINAPDQNGLRSNNVSMVVAEEVLHLNALFASSAT